MLVVVPVLARAAQRTLLRRDSLVDLRRKAKDRIKDSFKRSQLGFCKAHVVARDFDFVVVLAARA